MKFVEVHSNPIEQLLSGVTVEMVAVTLLIGWVVKLFLPVR